MKHALVIKTDMMLKPDVMKFYHDKFVEQLKSGVVIKAKLDENKVEE